jgi:hypothetical protein
MNKCPVCGMEADEPESSTYPCGTVKVDSPPTYINSYSLSLECFDRMKKSLPSEGVLTTLTPSPFTYAPHLLLSEYKDNV